MAFEFALAGEMTIDRLVLVFAKMLTIVIKLKGGYPVCLDRLLRNENFFKFKAKNQFNRRHTRCILRIKFIF